MTMLKTSPDYAGIFNEIRSTVVAFLNRCGIPYPRNICVDPEFETYCQEECIRRGYDMETLGPFLRVGIDIADPAYSHLKDKRLKGYIAIYTAFLTYLDDYCQTEAGVACISSFLGRFMNNEPQGYKMLDDLASVLKEANVYWRPITASLISSASLGFITSLFMDHETKDMKLERNAVLYPSFSRRLSGISDSYATFAFPPEMPIAEFIQAIPDICDYTNCVNDILSFYKEELQGEDYNYISLVGKTRGLQKLESLKAVAHETACAHERVLSLLKGEAYSCYQAYSRGYVGFHALCRRYKLDQLNM